MNFTEQLNFYIDKIQCSSKELAEASSISTAAISRYRTGDRIPNLKSQHLQNLCDGLTKLATDKKIDDIMQDDILTTLSSTLSVNSTNFEEIRKNFNELISILEINIAEMSRALSFDASYFSRIRTGKRIPSNVDEFVDSICNYVIHKYNSEQAKNSISLLINCNIENLQNDSTYFSNLKSWFFSTSTAQHNDINNFLKALDEFELNQYIKVVHFDEMKVPSVPFYKHSSKTYYGIEQMKQGELDFFKSTVLSKSNEPVFMCSDMPMEDMSKDVEFSKKWMFAIAMTLKKGLHLNIIHNLDRPFNEMMIGLESWIPIYMTGQVSPYYLKGLQNTIYCHFNYASGKVALTGECIKGFHKDGKYYLTSNSEEVAYYKTKSQNLLSKTQPLMKIYREDAKNSFESFIISDANIKGQRRRILASLPIHTLSPELLLNILKRNNISEQKQISIMQFANSQKELVTAMLKNGNILDELPDITQEEFEKYPITLALADCFCEDRITYTYEEYLQHLELTKQYSKEHANYNISINNQNIFRNIQIHIHEGKWVMISKNTNPAIHFVISHPKLRSAIENFIAPIKD